MLTNTAIWDPLAKTERSSKLDKKERFFRQCMWFRTEFDLNVLFIDLGTTKRLLTPLVLLYTSK